MHPTHWLISTQVPRCGHAIVNAAAFLTWPPGYRGVNDQFFVAQGGTFGRVARLYLCGNQNFTARSC